MNRTRFIAAAAALLAAPKAAFAARYTTIPYTPLDAVPYYDPIRELRAEHVDDRIWPAVKRINQSGWVWTAESCQGHRNGHWSRSPMLRLVCRTENAGKMLGILALCQHPGQISDEKPTEGVIELRRHNISPLGWYEIRVYVKRGGIAVFDRFAERIQGKG